MNDFWNEIYFNIEKLIGESFREARYRNDFYKFLLINGHTGSGKTISTMKKLEDDQYTWIYLTSFHQNITDNLIMSTLRHFDFIHLQSRRILCELKYYREIAERGVNIRPICENICILKETICPYYKRRRELYEKPKSWAGVHHHITSFLPDFFAMWKDRRKIHDYYDVMIIDENPIGVFYDMKIADPKILRRLKVNVNQVNPDHKNTNLVVEFLDYLIDCFPKDKKIDYNILFDYFKNINFETFYDNYQENLVENLRSGLIDVKDIPQEDYFEIFSLMHAKLEKDKLPYMILKTNKGDIKRRAYYLTIFKDSPLVNAPLPIIGLDGTANIDIWTTLVGKKPLILNKEYRYKNLYMLDTNARYPLTSWIRGYKISSTGERLCKLTDKICGIKKNDVLIAATIPLTKYIKKEIKAKNVQYCHFYYLRSRNDFYEKSDTLVVTCEPNVPPFRIECVSKLSNWDEMIWRQIFTQEEIVQSVGRIRQDKEFAPNGRKREEREIFIYPFAIYPNGDLIFKEAKLISEEELVFYIENGRFLAENFKNKLLEYE